MVDQEGELIGQRKIQEEKQISRLKRAQVAGTEGRISELASDRQQETSA